MKAVGLRFPSAAVLGLRASSRAHIKGSSGGPDAWPKDRRGPSLHSPWDLGSSWKQTETQRVAEAPWCVYRVTSAEGGTWYP